MALLLFQLCVVFTVGLLLGPASVWAGGGGPEGAAVVTRSVAVPGMRGASLYIPCGAPDPRKAATAPLKQSNMLDLSKSHSSSSSPSQRKQKGEESGDGERKRNYATVPLKDEDGDDGRYYDGINDSDYSKGIDSLDGSFDNYSPADADSKYTSDLSGDTVKPGKRKHGNRRRPEKKHLENTPKKPTKEKNLMNLITEGPPTYVWYHNETEILTSDQRRIVFANGTLYFKKLGSKKGLKGLQDSGMYRCLAKSENGAILSTSVTLSYAALDRDFTSYPVDSEIIEGDALQLLCTITSSPAAEIAWEKNSQRLPDDKRYYISTSGSLIITNTQRGDAGEYRCVATNTFLNKTRYSAPATVVILNSNPSKYPLQFVSTDETEDSYIETNEYNSSLRVTNVSVLYGDNISLGCAVKGMPKPKVTWNFRSDSSDVEVKEMSSMEVLRINSALEDSAGLYTCIASNGHHSIQQAYRLSVLRAPYFVLTPISERTPAAKTVRFNCSAGGSPSPKVTWYKDGRLLSITGRVKLKSADKKPPELIVTDTVSSDTGVYQCIASNSVGEASVWAALSVKSLGVSPPTLVKCLPVSSTALNLTWEAPTVLEVMAYTVHYFFADGGEEHSQIVLMRDYVLKNLEPYAKYELYTKIYAKPNGASDQSLHVICQGQGVPISLYAIDKSSMLVSWRETAAAIKTVKAWRIQWRLIDSNSSGTISNITVAENITTHIIEDIYPLIDYEFRVLASTTEDWLEQDLSLIHWTEGDKAIPLPAFDKGAHIEGKGTLPTTANRDPDELSNQKQEPATAVLDGSQMQPTHMSAEATGPRSMNLTWRCDAAESSLDGWIFVVCFSRQDETGDEIDRDKYKEKCTDSLTNWIEITGLDPGSLYSFKVQAVMQNQQTRGPFSETVTAHTKQDMSSSVTDVRWSVLDGGAVKITWTPNKKLLSVNKYRDSPIKNNTSNDTDIPPLTYTVYYSRNVLAPLINWTATNVTNNTQVELHGLNIDAAYYVMVSLSGEDRGTVVAIPPKGKMDTPLHNIIPDSSSDAKETSSNDQNFGIILGVALSLLGICVCGGIIVWQHRKFRRDPLAPQPSQLRTNRVARSDYECQELVGGPPPHIDSKGGVVYMNGVTSVPTKGRGVGEPLLNGHVHITENPRFSSKKHLPAMNGNCRPLLPKKSYGPINDGTLDVSRYEELPDVTVETVLENDLTLSVSNLGTDTTMPIDCEAAEAYTGISSDRYHAYNLNDPRVDSHISNSNTIELADSVSVHVDKNSNSEVSNVNKIKESVKNDMFDGINGISKSGAKNSYDKECIPGKYGGNRNKVDNLKNNSLLDAITTLDYRENGGSRRLAPALGSDG